jgi:hypothetical protein
MAFSGLFFPLMFLFACVASGGIRTDLLSLIEPADYFASRRMELGARSMLELASGTPTDARRDVRQLLAVRWLGENKDRLGEQREAVRQALARLARGPEGFAAEYAQTALARIDDKPVPVPRAAPKDGLREALEWFPKDVSLAVVLDARPPAGRPAEPDPELGRHLQRMLALYVKMMPADAREELYRFAEGAGNVRLDRLAVGFAPDPGASGNVRLFIRATGRMDHKRLAGYLRDLLGRNTAFAEKTGLRGEAVTTLVARDNPPAVTLIGTSDLILAGYVSAEVNCASLAEEVLAVRDGGRPSLLAGPLGKTLRDVPADAVGLVRGSLPRDLAIPIARSPLGVAPDQVAIDLLSASPSPSPASGFVLRCRCTFVSEADARQFAGGLRAEVKQVIEALKELSDSSPPAGLATIRKELEKIEVGSDGLMATVKVSVSAETLKALLRLVEGSLPK